MQYAEMLISAFVIEPLPLVTEQVNPLGESPTVMLYEAPVDRLAPRVICVIADPLLAAIIGRGTSLFLSVNDPL